MNSGLQFHKPKRFRGNFKTKLKASKEGKKKKNTLKNKNMKGNKTACKGCPWLYKLFSVTAHTPCLIF
jgi:hypothetical protein